MIPISTLQPRLEAVFSLSGVPEYLIRSINTQDSENDSCVVVSHKYAILHIDVPEHERMSPNTITMARGKLF